MPCPLRRARTSGGSRRPGGVRSPSSVRARAIVRGARLTSPPASSEALDPLHHVRSSLNSAALALSDSRCGRAGYPPHVSPAGMSLITPACAASRAPAPIVRWPAMPTWPARIAPSSTRLRPRDADLRHEQAQPPDAHVVPDVHEVVDLRAVADHGVVDAAAVDREFAPISTSLPMRQRPTCGIFSCAPPREHVAESVAAQPRAAVHGDAVAEARARIQRDCGNRWLSAPTRTPRPITLCDRSTRDRRSRRRRG